jgi:predicted nucleotidyltransferase
MSGGPMMRPEVNNEIKKIAARVAQHTAARRIILFGSYAAGTQKKGSDLDICVITDDTRRKVDILRELNRTIGYESTIPLDIVVYSTREFYDRADSLTSLESRILKTGVDIHP